MLITCVACQDRRKLADLDIEEICDCRVAPPQGRRGVPPAPTF